MEWQLMLLLILGFLILLMASGLPVAICFFIINVIGAFFLWGGEAGLRHLTHSLFASVSSFTILPVPLFILMGEVMFYSGVAPLMIDAMDKWLSRLPGRLSLLAVGSGTLFATLTGSSMSGVAMLGTVLVPEMEKRGYKKVMSIGPILAAGGLAVMIPPSALAVLLGAIGEISVGRILMGIILPGVLLAVLYTAYIIVRCWLQPSLAPPYEVPPVSLLERLVATARYILPVGIIVFLVTGVIVLGIATPTEAAASGALGTFLLAVLYRRLNWEVVKKSMGGTLQVTGMIFLIMTGAKAFSQILAISGASQGLMELAINLPVAPILIIVAMQVILLFLGMFIEVVAMMMITVPIFVPVVHALGFELPWFAVLYLINIEVAAISPPFGLSLFVMKGVASPDTTMGDIYKASLPFIGLILIALALVIIFPAVALWLPSMMR